MTERRDDGPTPEQLARGEHERAEVVVSVPGGGKEAHLVHRRVDSVRLLLKRGQITPAQYAAALRFQTDYRLAALDPMRAAALDRVGGGPAEEVEHIEHIESARRRVAAALKAVGGRGSLGALAVEYVVGMNCAIAAVKAEIGVRFNPKILTGALIAALSVLAGDDSLRARFGGFSHVKIQGIDKTDI